MMEKRKLSTLDGDLVDPRHGGTTKKKKKLQKDDSAGIAVTKKVVVKNAEKSNLKLQPAVLVSDKKIKKPKSYKKGRDQWGRGFSEKPKPILVKPDKNQQGLSSNWKLLAQKLGVDKVERKTEKLTSNEMDSKKSNKKFGSSTSVQVELYEKDKVKTCLQLFDYNHYGGFKSEPPVNLPQNFKCPTKCLAIDCEMVGIGPTSQESTLARVSIVNEYGYCILDRFVKPKVQVTDYRTKFSGIRREDLENAKSLESVMQEVADLIKDKILVGHSIINDFKVLLINHPKSQIRDTQRYFKKGRKPSLRMLAEKLLSIKIQEGEHSSIQDAKATMALYLLHRKDWENDLKSKNINFRIKRSKSSKKKKNQTFQKPS